MKPDVKLHHPILINKPLNQDFLSSAFCFLFQNSAAKKAGTFKPPFTKLRNIEKCICVCNRNNKETAGHCDQLCMKPYRKIEAAF